MAARSSTVSRAPWCVNAGHGRKEISQAVARSLEQMDFAPPFNMGHPQAFDLANKIKKTAPAGSIMCSS